MIFLSTRDFLPLTETMSDECDAPAICNRFEHERGDGFRVVATSNGKIVACSAGWWTESGLTRFKPKDLNLERRRGLVVIDGGKAGQKRYGATFSEAYDTYVSDLAESIIGR